MRDQGPVSVVSGVVCGVWCGELMLMLMLMEPPAAGV